MIILPLEIYFTMICTLAESSEFCKGQILALPDSVETIVFAIGMQLNPVVSLIPGHAVRLEIVHEVNGSEGMLA